MKGVTGAVALSAALLAGCSGVTDPSPAVIPDATWVREVTTAEITSRGLELTPEELASNYLADGAAQVVLKTQGNRWAVLVQDDAGEFELGDMGKSSYDDDGRWVQSSDATGDALLLVWTLTGDTLTTADLTTASGGAVDDDGAHLFLEGTWQRQG